MGSENQSEGWLKGRGGGGVSGRKVLTWLLAVCMIALPGCTWLTPYRGEPYHGDDATWGATMRAREEKQGEVFFNEKSRQIEKSLGL